MNQVKNRVGVVIKKHDLTIESVFIPWSQSRSAGEKDPSLNWRVTLKQGGRAILSTDYSAGCAHAPSYNQRGYNTVDGREAVRNECESGKKSLGTWGRGEAILPDSHDVIYSLLMDSEVLDYNSFEDWADSIGYDTDSRQAEQIYNSCLKIALQFHKIGESVIEELREVYQDY